MPAPDVPHVAGGRRVAVLAALAAVLAGSAAHGWLTARTRRLYLEAREDQTPAAAAAARWRQAFTIQHGRVVPQIRAEGQGVLRFAHQARRDSVLHVDAVWFGPATHEVAVRDAAGRHVVAGSRADDTRVVSYTVPLAASEVVVELTHRGWLVWSDARIEERGGEGAAALAGLGALVVLAAILPRAPAEVRRRVYGGVLAAVTALASVGVLEGGLRLAGARLPQWVLDAREDLGTPAGDPGWQESLRYLGRHAPRHRRAIAWREGDIVWMGFVPADAVTPEARRHDFVTDAEGFRNPEVRDRIHVAALGDSFTDGMMVAREDTWPARLEAALGRPVQNYGTAGFAPPQESFALEDFALEHHPRVVVVAFFAGNDLQEAHDFAEWRAGRVPVWTAGWRIRPEVQRHETLFVRALVVAAAQRLSSAARIQPPASEPPLPARPHFDRGVYVIPRAGRRVEVALMPPTLRRLPWSRAEVEAHPGWKPNADALRRMRRASQDAGARLLVLFIPSRCQVFLPLLEQTFGRDGLRAQVASYFPDEPNAVDLDAALAHRLAQNEAMAALCAREGIAFLDLTPALEDGLRRGESPYFAHDTHWNPSGHRVAAETLAAELRRLGWDRD